MSKTEKITIVIYTIINIRLMLPFIFNDDLILAAALKEGVGGNAYPALFIGLFLNAALIVYLVRKK